MLFNSFSFAIFFPVVVITYFLLPQKFRNFFLLAASCVFYMAFVPKYILILFTLITLDFFLAQLMSRQEGRRRDFYLWMSVAANLAMLFFFKYFNFFNVNVAELATFLHWNYSPFLLSVVLPIGLSFHIFQSLGYVIEVYKKRFVPERDYLTYALYVMFFPQLVAGPIERPAHLLPQLRQVHSFDAGKMRRGLERMLWGFFKKLVIADNIAVIVNHMYSSQMNDGWQIVIATVLFAFQDYCDFSGYADIAVGSALVLGYDIMENFNRPFASRSVGEFWRRWHISLSSWLRDYVYYPMVLGGKGQTVLRLYVSLFVSFILIGLWHGANWTYVIFGALNGFYLVFGSVTQGWRRRVAEFVGLTRVPRLHHTLQVLTTFGLFCFCLIYFRAVTLEQAWHLTLHLTNQLGSLEPVLKVFTFMPTTDQVRLFVALCGIGLVECVQWVQARLGTFYIFDMRARIVRYGWYYALIVMILILGYGQGQPFIYFQF